MGGPSRHRVTMVGLAAGCMVLLAFLVVAVAAPAPVVLGGTRPEAPAVSGGRIVWVDRTYGNADVFMYDAATRAVSRLTTDPADQSDPAISGSIVVWSDKRSGKGTIRALDLETGVERDVSPNVSDQVRPSISGTWVVWEDYRNSYNPGIYGRDLAGGAERRIASGLGASTRRPKVSGTLVVWEDYATASGAGDIKSYDLSTGATRVIANSGSSELLPDTDGRYVVYAQASSGGMDVIGYDTATGTRTTLTGQRGEQTFPGVSAGKAFWIDNTSGARLHGDTYSFAAGSPSRFDDAGTADITNLVIRDGTAAWLQRRGSGWQLVARVDAALARTVAGTFGRYLPRTASAPLSKLAAAPQATKPLEVAATSVANGQRRVDPRSRLRVTFSKPIDASAANLAHVYLVEEPLGRKVRARVTYDRRSASVQVLPASRLPERLYSLVIDDRILDSTGGQIAEGARVTFSTIRTLAEVSPPTAPNKVTARVDGLSNVTISWLPSTDDVGVVAYDVYRSNAPTQMTDHTTQGALVASVATTSATVPVKSDEASCSYTYNYVVVARDASGKTAKSLNALPDPHGVNSSLTDTCSRCHAVHGGSSSPFLGAASATDCYRCHGATGSTGDYGYNSTFDTQARFQDDSVIATTGPNRTSGPAGSVHRNAFMVTNGHDCDSCHSPHRKPYDTVPSASFNRIVRTQIATPVPAGNPGSAYRYNTDASAVGNQMCFDCHGAPSDNAQTLIGIAGGPAAYASAGGDHRTNYANTAHGDPAKLPAAGTNPGIQCLACHDEHAGAVPDLLGRFDPVSGTSRITSGSVVTTLTGNDNSVCFGCHAAATPGWPNASENASGYPNRGTWPGKATWDVAYSTVTHKGSFHASSTVAWSGAGEAGGDCKNCHVIHGADYQNPVDILRRDAAGSQTYGPAASTFCFKCHAGDGPAADDMARFFPTTVGGDRTQTASTRFGHKTLSSGRLPAGAALPCYDCHNPHGSGSAYGLAVVTMSGGTTITVGEASGEVTMTAGSRTDADVRNFCFTCHTSADRARGWTGSAMATVAASDYVEGIRRDTYNAAGAHLRLPPATGHDDADTEGCYDCHGESYAGATANNVHNPSGGVSDGGQRCYTCHTAFRNPMESTGASRTLSFHHVLGGGSFASNGDTATPGGTGPYPTSNSDVYCISCHADHNYFNGNKGANLRTNIASSTVTAAASDFTTNAGLGYGICVSCHRTSITKDTNQRSDGFSSKTATISGSAYAVSAHRYQIDASFGGSTFSADCSKCHSDDQTKRFQDAGRAQFGTHFSSERRILAALGVAVPLPTVSEPGFCYRCHSRASSATGGTKKTSDAVDWYGKAMTRGIDIFDAINQGGSKHPVTGGATGSLTCESCHNPHVVQNGNPVSDPDNTYASMARGEEFCLKCHDGAVPTYQVGASLVPTTVVMTQPGMDKTTYEARSHWVVTTYTCTSCHDPHGSRYPKLLGKYFAGDQNIAGFPITGNNNTVCTTCHGFGSAPAGPTLARIDQEEASRDASGFILGAISPGRWAGPTVYSNATYSPHGVTAKQYLGQDVKDCKTCHDVHGTANKYGELVETYTPSAFDLCFSCHDGSVGTTDIKRYYPASVGGGGNAAPNAGHKIVTAGGKLPVGASLPCYDCHGVHGSANSNTQLKADYRWANLGDTKVNTANSRIFCLGCHVTNDFRDGYGNSLAASDTSNTVEGLPRRPSTKPANKLLLSANAAHASGSGQGCFECHGNDYSSAASNNVHNPGGALSNGGSACYGCHPSYLSMEDNAGAKLGSSATTANSSVYHHVLGGAAGDGDIAPNAGLYPTSTVDVYCVSCHNDHNYFNSAKAVNLRTTVTNSAGSAATNTDFIASGSPSYGICVSCHTVSKAKQGLGTEQAAAQTANTPVIDGARFGVSAHQYTASSTFGGGTTFRANCSKCHTDEQDKSYQSAREFGTHFSAFAGILRVLGGFTANPPEAEACLKCHDTDGGVYGETMSAAAKATWDEFQSSSKHPLDKVTCANCHNVHRATVATAAADPENTYAGASLATTANANAYCLKCHDGTLPAAVTNDTTLVPYAMSANATANVAAFYAASGHGGTGIGPAFSGRVFSQDATAYTVSSGTWTNPERSMRVDGFAAISPTTNTWDLRNTFSFPSPMGTIDSASLTVRARAPGGWGSLKTPASSVTRTLFATSTVSAGSWTRGGTPLPPTLHEAIDEAVPDGDTSYITAVDRTEYQGAFAKPVVPSTATNIRVAVTWAVKDPGNRTQNEWCTLAVNGTYYAGPNHDPGPSTTTYYTYTDTFTVNPATNAAWTWDTLDDINGLGVDQGGTRQHNVTQMYVTISYDIPAVYNDDTWAIQYTVDGLVWNDIVSPRSTPQLTFLDYPADLTGILTNANKANFALRVVGTPGPNGPGNTGTFEIDGSTLQLTYSGNDPGDTRSDCRDCHEQHGSRLPYLLATSVDGTSVPVWSDTADQAQCLACHRAGGTPLDTDIARYYPASAYGSSTKARSGHRTINAGTLGPDSPLPCRSCHDPHGGDGSGYMLKVRTQTAPGADTFIGDQPGELAMSKPQTAANVRKFCFTCHTDRAGGIGWDGANYTAVDGGCEVLGISRTGGVLRLPAISSTGHDVGDTSDSCYDCHGNAYANALSVNVHNPSGGVSDGGESCYGCHKTYRDPMDRTGATKLDFFHHTLGSETTAGDVASFDGAYPAEKGNVYCVSCHTDHNYFSGAKGSNLRRGIDRPGSETANSDFIASGSYGICVSCHSVQQTKDNANQKTDGAPVTGVVRGQEYAGSAHDYAVSSSFGGSAFNGNCVKCHDDGQATKYQTGSNTWAVHFSAESRLLAAMGVTVTNNRSASALCYKCHSTTGNPNQGAGKDYYNVANMSSKALGIETAAGSTYKHPIGNNPTAHKSVEGTQAGWNPGTNRHVECEDCHNPHAAKTGVTSWPDNTAYRSITPTVPGALLGVWGIDVDGNGDANWNGGSTTTGTPIAPTYSRIETSSYQWQVCLKCHTGYAWSGGTVPNVSLNLQNQTGGKQTDVAVDFSPKNYAMHPIFAQGKNQPPTNANGEWYDSNYAGLRDDLGTTGGLSNTLTDGWLTTSRVVCTDCHTNSSSTGSEGPHGSARRWLLKGADVNVKVTVNSGAVTYPNTGMTGNFCANCHRADVYGKLETAGDSWGPTYAAMSRLNHASTMHPGDCGDLGVLGAAIRYTGCFNCHGARKDTASYGNPTNAVVQSGAIHGTSMGKGNAGLGDNMGYRFMNGASWVRHDLGDRTGTQIGCYNFSGSGDNYSTCTHHGGSSYDAEYLYQVQ